jgi:hypothetical protein
MRRTIKKDLLGKLSPNEKAKLRIMLESPEYQKLLSIAENFRPSASCGLAGSGSRDAFSDSRANARLGEIRGWELHVMAMFSVITPPKELAQQIEESYPDSGLLEADTFTQPRKQK